MQKAFDNLPEKYEKYFPTMNHLRKEIAIEAGYFNIIYDFYGNPRREAQSICYEKMDQEEFERFYSKSLDILLKIIFVGMTEQEFTNELMNFI